MANNRKFKEQNLYLLKYAVYGYCFGWLVTTECDRTTCTPCCASLLRLLNYIPEVWNAAFLTYCYKADVRGTESIALPFSENSSQSGSSSPVQILDRSYIKTTKHSMTGIMFFRSCSFGTSPLRLKAGGEQALSDTRSQARPWTTNYLNCVSVSKATQRNGTSWPFLAAFDVCQKSLVLASSCEHAELTPSGPLLHRTCLP